MAELVNQLRDPIQAEARELRRAEQLQIDANLDNYKAIYPFLLRFYENQDAVMNENQKTKIKKFFTDIILTSQPRIADELNLRLKPKFLEAIQNNNFLRYLQSADFNQFVNLLPDDKKNLIRSIVPSPEGGQAALEEAVAGTSTALVVYDKSNVPLKFQPLADGIYRILNLLQTNNAQNSGAGKNSDQCTRCMGYLNSKNLNAKMMSMDQLVLEQNMEEIKERDSKMFQKIIRNKINKSIEYNTNEYTNSLTIIRNMLPGKMVAAPQLSRFGSFFWAVFSRVNDTSTYDKDDVFKTLTSFGDVKFTGTGRKLTIITQIFNVEIDGTVIKLNVDNMKNIGLVISDLDSMKPMLLEAALVSLWSIIKDAPTDHKNIETYYEWMNKIMDKLQSSKRDDIDEKIRILYTDNLLNFSIGEMDKSGFDEEILRYENQTEIKKQDLLQSREFKERLLSDTTQVYETIRNFIPTGLEIPDVFYLFELYSLACEQSQQEYRGTLKNIFTQENEKLTADNIALESQLAEINQQSANTNAVIDIDCTRIDCKTHPNTKRSLESRKEQLKTKQVDLTRLLRENKKKTQQNIDARVAEFIHSMKDIDKTNLTTLSKWMFDMLSYTGLNIIKLIHNNIDITDETCKVITNKTSNFEKAAFYKLCVDKSVCEAEKNDFITLFYNASYIPPFMKLQLTFNTLKTAEPFTAFVDYTTLKNQYKCNYSSIDQGKLKTNYRNVINAILQKNNQAKPNYKPAYDYIKNFLPRDDRGIQNSRILTCSLNVIYGDDKQHENIASHVANNKRLFLTTTSMNDTPTKNNLIYDFYYYLYNHNVDPIPEVATNFTSEQLNYIKTIQYFNTLDTNNTLLQTLNTKTWGEIKPVNNGSERFEITAQLILQCPSTKEEIVRSKAVKDAAAAEAAAIAVTQAAAIAAAEAAATAAAEAAAVEAEVTAIANAEAAVAAAQGELSAAEAQSDNADMVSRAQANLEAKHTNLRTTRDAAQAQAAARATRVAAAAAAAEAARIAAEVRANEERIAAQRRVEFRQQLNANNTDRVTQQGDAAAHHRDTTILRNTIARARDHARAGAGDGDAPALGDAPAGALGDAPAAGTAADAPALGGGASLSLRRAVLFASADNTKSRLKPKKG